MQATRRQWLVWGAGSVAAAAGITGCANTPAPAGAPGGAPGFVRRKVGNARVVALSDGVGRRPLAEGFVRNATLAQVKATLAAQDLPTDYIDVPYTCFVLETEGKRYLLDTGFADNGPPGTGQLVKHMRAAGIDPESIDAVVLSHLHGDHINGLRRKDGSLVFPQALVYVPAPEHAFWLDADRRNAAPEAARAGFMAVQRVFQDYPADQLRLFEPGMAVVGGIESIAAFGHSPGHTALALRSGNERFTYLGDAAHFPALFVRNPDWQVQFDMDPAQARATRHALLARMAQEGGLVGGFHFPLPALGRIRKQGDGYQFVPEK
ncbi:MBL fold metallo-hydrolase [Comamonas antarctica]|uniref:MBL fold metallo-hydrolase n=1 Tax=Comamonas antarctica TaxID=2743470 RepID=UPI0028E502BC|nr:MBL fold metallo-hydrolase [Comamonas antarctica]